MRPVYLTLFDDDLLVISFQNDNRMDSILMLWNRGYAMDKMLIQTLSSL